MATIEKSAKNKVNQSQEQQNTPKFISRDQARFSVNVGDKKLGTVSYGAYKAIESNTLDSYTPKDDEEKKAIETYRLHNSAELKKDDGTSLGFVTQEGLKAIQENNTDKYNPINEDERKAIVSYIDYATKKRQEAIENYKASAQKELVDIETGKAEITDESGKLRRERAFTSRAGKRGTKWEAKDTRTGKEKRQGKPIPKSDGEKELENLDRKYANLDKEAEELVDAISNIEKYANITYKEDSFFGQAKANYGQTRLNQDMAQAYNDYVASGNEDDKARADALSATLEQFAILSDILSD